MIIIGEKINGSIPSVGAAIAAKDEALIRNLARIQTAAGADYIDVCASVRKEEELETLKWLIRLVQEETELPISVDSPDPRSCVAAMEFCKKPGIVNSVSMEGDKTEVIFPAIAGTEWQCVALLCGSGKIARTAGERLAIAEQLMERAAAHGIAHSRIHIDPMVVSLATEEGALTVFAECSREIKSRWPGVYVTSGLSNISFGLPARKALNQGFLALAMNAGMDSVIMDPTNRDMLGLAYAVNALLGKDEYCMEYIGAFRAGRIGPLPKA